jgi:DNA-binding protein H-NS
MAKLTDLLAQKAALEKKIAQARRAERADAIEQVRALMARYGLTLADLGSTRRPARATAPVAEAAPQPAARAKDASPRKARVLGKVMPKYRDPSTGSTWSGRGLKPRWLSAALAAGRTLEEVRIDHLAPAGGNSGGRGAAPPPRPARAPPREAGGPGAAPRPPDAASADAG